MRRTGRAVLIWLAGILCVFAFSLNASAQNSYKAPQSHWDASAQKVKVDVFFYGDSEIEQASIPTRNPFAEFNLQRRKRDYRGHPEEIKSYIVYMKVQPNGDLDIIENITVHADWDDINRGIFRDLPFHKKVTVPYLDKMKLVSFLPFMPSLKSEEHDIAYRYELDYIKRNGSLEPFKIFPNSKNEPQKLRIRIGKYLLSQRDHVYEIAYTVKDEIRRFEDADELYWNVIGTDVNFYMHDAQIFIETPPGLTLQDSQMYTGRQGFKFKDATLTKRDNLYHIQSTKQFWPREGITVSLKWDKGVFAEQPLSTRLYYFSYHFRNPFFLIFAIVSFSMFLFAIWFKYGRNPKPAPVFPRYVPPPDYSAAAVSYIYNKGRDGHRALYATLKSLQFKKSVDLRTTPSLTEISPLADLGHSQLDQDENTLKDALFPHQESDAIFLREEYNAAFHDGYDSFRETIKKRYGTGYYMKNGWRIFLTFLASLSYFFILSFFEPPGLYMEISVIITGFMIGAFILFWVQMHARTKKGQSFFDYIEGLKLYLRHADGDNLNAYEIGGKPPPMSLERYQELLPYAIALQLEKPWTNYFQSVMPWDEMEIEFADYAITNFQGDMDDMDKVVRRSLTVPPPVYTDSGSSSYSSYDDDDSSSYSSSSYDSSSSSSSGGGGGGSSGGGGGGGGVSGW